MKKLLLALILAWILFTGCVQEPEEKPAVLPANVEKVSFQTFDGVIIKANYFPSSAEQPVGVILLHMLGQDKSSWNEFASKLQENGFTVLAIDFRGHGESILQDSKTLNWNKFSETEFNLMTQEVASAKSFLTKKGINEDRVFIAGASLGANIALNYAITDSQLKGIALLSPGLNYKGVLTLLAVRKIVSTPVLFVASNEDSYAFSSAKQLFNETIGSEKQLMLLEGKGHGSEMLKDENVSATIINWLKEKNQ